MTQVLSLKDRAQALEAVERLIDAGIARRNRGAPGDAYGTHPTSGRPNYVHRMCEDLLAFCHQHGATSVSLEDVLLVDTLSSGHCDYFSKFSLRVTELCIGAAGPSTVRNW